MRSVGRYVLGSSATEVLAVWDVWSAPAPIEPQFVEASDAQFGSATVAGPNGTLLVIWTNSRPQSPGAFVGDGTTRISKYVGGNWSTVQFASTGGEQLRGAAINGAGQAAVLLSGFGCAGANCEELALYRF